MPFAFGTVVIRREAALKWGRVIAEEREHDAKTRLTRAPLPRTRGNQ